MFALLQQLMFGVCFLSVSLFFLSASLLLRNIPALYDFFMRLLRNLLQLSYRFYRALLLRLHPYSLHYLNLNILDGSARLIASVMLSLIFGLAILLLLRWSPTMWNVGIFILHGIFIGLAWEDFFEPQGLRMGERME